MTFDIDEFAELQRRRIEDAIIPNDDYDRLTQADALVYIDMRAIELRLQRLQVIATLLAAGKRVINMDGKSYMPQLSDEDLALLGFVEVT